MQQSECAASVDALVRMFSRKSNFEIDLSNSSLIDVVLEYEKFKKRMHPNYNTSSLRRNLEIVQVMSGHVLMPNDITDVFYSAFSAWLTNNDVKYSSQKTYISALKAALTWGLRHNLNLSQTFDVIDIPKYEPFTIALSADDVSHIAHFDISKMNARADLKKTLEKVRDHFVLSCNLGQRYSDMTRITPENFERNMFIIVQQKTGNKALMDIDKFSITPKLVYKILDKYNHKAPYSGNINNYNHYLHKLIKAIGGEFNEDIKIETKVAGKIITTYKKKYELIASHTARRTFTTFNAFRQIPMGELMKATGHKSMSSFQQYIKY